MKCYQCGSRRKGYSWIEITETYEVTKTGESVDDGPYEVRHIELCSVECLGHWVGWKSWRPGGAEMTTPCTVKI